MLAIFCWCARVCVYAYGRFFVGALTLVQICICARVVTTSSSSLALELPATSVGSN
jgi:hypothetical protein